MKAFAGLTRAAAALTLSASAQFAKAEDAIKYRQSALFVMGQHVLAIIFYVRVRKQQLIRPMLDGDKTLTEAAAPSRDDAQSRIAALVVLALSAGVAWWVSSLAAPAF